MTCRRFGDTIICGPTEVVTLTEKSVGVHWCFVCRKRVEFTDALMDDAKPSYYGPWWQRTCPSGHLDGDLFPGRYREWRDL